MSIHHFGTLTDGTEVSEIRLRTDAGTFCSVITFGAAVHDLVVTPGQGGNRRVVLGFPTLDGYLADTNYIGVTAGRYASRIRGGLLRIDGRDYQLTLNDDGRNHLHGGRVGFSARPWRILWADERSVVLALTSPDGDQGYPGTLEARCTYRLEEPATLRIVMSAVSDAPTVVNLAHHSYLNLTPGETIGRHLLQVDASHAIAFDDARLPTGEILSVAGTAKDFRDLRPIRMAGEGAGQEYDMAFVLARREEGLARVAMLLAPDRQLGMELRTTEPCLVFYDGGHITAGAPGFDGVPYGRHAGLCLEPQLFPDSPNQPWFPAAVLRPGVTYRQVTEYRFHVPPRGEGDAPAAALTHSELSVRAA